MDSYGPVGDVDGLSNKLKFWPAGDSLNAIILFLSIELIPRRIGMSDIETRDGNMTNDPQP